MTDERQYSKTSLVRTLITDTQLIRTLGDDREWVKMPVAPWHE